jgi:hypothetical protein
MSTVEAANGSTAAYMPENILITGGCGFIASHVAIRLAKRYPQYKVSALTKYVLLQTTLRAMASPCAISRLYLVLSRTLLPSWQLEALQPSCLHSDGWVVLCCGWELLHVVPNLPTGGGAGQNGLLCQSQQPVKHQRMSKLQGVRARWACSPASWRGNSSKTAAAPGRHDCPHSMLLASSAGKLAAMLCWKQ